MPITCSNTDKKPAHVSYYTAHTWLKFFLAGDELQALVEIVPGNYKVRIQHASPSKTILPVD
jgi:hypothetical protein